MTVENYIKDLLYRYECVIIPGFGALISQRKPAEIHSTTNAFYPPKKVVSFNRQLSKNDGLLANYIAETEKIRYEKALYKIHQFSQQLKTVLSEEKEISLENIGVFKMEKGDKLLFQPSYHQNYLLDAFGLASFTSPEIKRVPQQAQDYKKEVKALEEKTGLVFTHEKKVSAKHAYLKYAAVGLLALGLSGFAGMNWYSGKVQSHNLAAQQSAENQLEQKIQKATFTIGNPLPEITFKVDVQTGKYHIVAGAFRAQENAEKKTQQLIEKGFHAREIGKSKYGLYQVVYSSYENRSEALKALREIKRSDNENAWLLVQDL